jgi:hypothetical protein
MSAEDEPRADAPEPSEPREPTEPQEPSEPPPDVGELHREAANYRRRLRDTETERDQLRQRVDAMERREVERTAAVHMEPPGDLWSVGPSLEDLRARTASSTPTRCARPSTGCSRTAHTGVGAWDPATAAPAPRQGSQRGASRDSRTSSAKALDRHITAR